MKKGFTLMELLAVIVILAIIALIAVPIVLNIINNSKEKSVDLSIDNYAHAVELAIAQYQIKENKKPTSLKQIKKYIEYSGSKVECKTDIYEDGSIYLYECKVDGIELLHYTYGKRKLPENIGEVVLYNANVPGYSGQWRILGTENGQILLLSDSIGTLTLEGRDGVNTGIDKLNEMAEPYGHGVGAIKSRPIKAEDINKIADYKPTNAGIDENDDGSLIYGTFDAGTISEYGTNTTYTLKDGKITFTSSNGLSSVFNLSDYEFENFTDLNGHVLNNGETFSVKNEYYHYSISTSEVVSKPSLRVVGSGKRYYIPTTTPILHMLNGSANAIPESDNYWLANSMSFAKPNSLSWGIMNYGVASHLSGNVMRNRLWNAYVGSNTYTYKVRVVVHLDENVTLTKNSDGNWLINTNSL